MKVIAEETWSWMLLNKGDDFLLSVLCGSVGLFELHIRLNEAEKSQYLLHDVSYISNLAEEVRLHPAAFSPRHIASFDDLPGVSEATQAWVAART
ncbi:MAG TPA: hypothetical protein VIU34_37070 [Steroidobacter sp.]